MYVIKRNGIKEEYDFEKIKKRVKQLCDGIDDITDEQITSTINLYLHDGISTREIDECILNTAVDLIDESLHPEIGNVNYDKVASKLAASMLYKDVYHTEITPHIYDIIKSNIELGLYSKDLLTMFSKDDWYYLNSHIKHERDKEISFAGLSQLKSKYLLQNRTTNKLLETPQIRFMICSAVFFCKRKEQRLETIVEFYEYLSQSYFSLSTPLVGGLGTKTKKYNSCTTIIPDDDIDSINSTGHMISNYAAARAGIGTDVSMIRGSGSPIRNGEIKHPGLIPFIKKFYADLRAVSQGGARQASATVSFQFWHYDFENLIVLKNNQGIEETRVRQLDYSVVLNKLFFDRILSGGNITFFDPNEVKDLYNAFYEDFSKFEELYIKYENDPSKRKKTQKAEEVAFSILKERRDTGRIYLLFIDNVRDQGPYDPKTDPVRHSNLCFTGDTLVAVADGRNAVSMKSLYEEGKEFEVYSARQNKSKNTLVGKRDGGTIKNSEYVPLIRKAKAIYTGQREMIKVILEDGDSFNCTPDHQLATTKFGKWVNAEDSLGEYLEPFSTYAISKKYSNQYNVDHINNNLIWKGRKVVAIENIGVQDCYDVSITEDNLDYNNHNFFIITSGDKNYREFKGVLVHNCQEIMLHTRPFKSITDTNGRIGLCTLAANNLGKYKKPQDMKRPLQLLLEGLSNVLSYQDFVSIQSELHTKEYEPIGIGITNLAYWMAKHKLKYGEENTLTEIKKWMEYQTFYLLEESVRLAKERGPCERSQYTSYGKGIFIWEKRAKGVDELTDFTPNPDIDWEGLRKDMIKYGVRNSVMSAHPPCESSSAVINATNGFEMVRELIIVKDSKNKGKKIVQVVPEYHKLKKHYQLLWDQKDCLPYLKTCAVIQAYTDQGMSANTWYSGKNYENGIIPFTIVLKNIMLGVKWGLKSLYYDLSDKDASKDKIEKSINNDINKYETNTTNNDNLPNVDSDEDDGECESCKL